MNTITIVPIEFIHQAWEKVGKWVEDAMEHAKGECTADQLKVSTLQITLTIGCFILMR